MDTQAWVDQYDAHIASTVRRFGTFIQYVGGNEECSCEGCENVPDDSPAFAYTVGLFGLGHPELLVFGVDSHTAAHLLNELSDRIRSGENLVAGQLIKLQSFPSQIVAEEVPNPGEIVFTANDFYRRPDAASVPVLQLSYEEGGIFPWDSCYPDPARQPRPGTFSALPGGPF